MSSSDEHGEGAGFQRRWAAVEVWHPSSGSPRPGVGEMIHAATMAIVSGITLDELWHAVPALPAVREVWLRLLESERGTA